MLAGKTQVWDVEEGGGTMVHRQEGGISLAVYKTYPLPGIQSRTYRRFEDGA